MAQTIEQETTCTAVVGDGTCPNKAVLHHDKCIGHGGGAPQCGARLRKSDPPRYCKKAPLHGRTRCRLHGGLSPAGVANTNFKEGKYSKYMPTELLALYNQQMADPDLISSRDEISLITSRIAQLLAGIDDDEETGGGQAWGEMRDAHDEFRRAMRDGDPDEMAIQLDRMTAFLNSGLATSKLWLSELIPLIDQRRKLVDIERRRIEAAHRVLTAEQAMAFVRAVYAVVMEEVTDARVRTRIGEKIQALITR